MKSGERSQDYFQAAATLRLCLEYNQEDTEHAASSGRINYLMDANVVRFFMAPEREFRLVEIFGHGSTGDYAIATAAATAEFLFSRRLPGQQGRPVLIAPGHAEDLSDIAGALVREGRGDLSAPELDPPDQNTAQMLRDLIERASRGEVDRREAVRKFYELVPKTARYVLEGNYQAAAQLLRLHRGDLIRQLQSHPAATSDILDCSEQPGSLAHEWNRRLLLEHRRRGQSVSLKTRHLARRDATALAQVIMLDREARPATRFVLVTADRVLFDAYAAWYWTERVTSDPTARFVLRLPLQYLPILNPNEMPNGIVDSTLMAQTRTTLEALFANLKSTDKRYPHILAWYQARHGADPKADETRRLYYGFDPLKPETVGGRQFEGLQHEWRQAFRGGVLYGAELISRRDEANFSRLAQLLRDDAELRDLIVEDHRRVLNEVEQAHLIFSMEVNVVRLPRRLREARHRGAAQRATPIVRARCPRVIGSLEMDEALEKLESGDAALLGQVEEALREVDEQALFFAACVVYRGGLWYASWHYVDRGLAMAARAERTDMIEEMTFLRASAARYALADQASVSLALRDLDDMIVRHRQDGNAFGLARALCEHWALVLVLVYSEALADELWHSVRLPGATSRLSELKDRSDEVEHALYNARRSEPAEEGRLNALALQAYANVVSTDLYIRMLAPGGVAAGFAVPRDAAFQALAHVEGRLRSEDCPTVLRVECCMLRYALGDLGRDDALAQMRAAATAAQQREFQSTELDRAEQRWFERRLTSAAEHGRMAPDATAVLAE